MKTETEQLMKHFATILRGRATGKLKIPSIDTNVMRYFTRKELIEIVSKRFNSTIPKEHNLMELENKELLELIGDDMYIISYVTEQWSKDIASIKKIHSLPDSNSEKTVSKATEKKPETPKK